MKAVKLIRACRRESNGQKGEVKNHFKFIKWRKRSRKIIYKIPHKPTVILVLGGFFCFIIAKGVRYDWVLY